ncbi:MAG: High-potential iron-sulfur protein [Gammaproteobacteria bacterium]|nr:High-potential iron-sulfur protein [Gammaproteobacteria bacterium]
MATLISRRGLLRSSLQLTLAGTIAAATGVAAAADQVCADPKGMDSGLASSLHYSELSPDPSKSCSACGLFQAGSSGCGSCAIFSATVNSKGHCDSWSARG